MLNLKSIERLFDTKAFDRLLSAVAANGLSCVQFNFETVGLPDMPERIDTDLSQRIAFLLSRNHPRHQIIARIFTLGRHNFFETSTLQSGLRPSQS